MLRCSTSAFGSAQSVLGRPCPGLSHPVPGASLPVHARVSALDPQWHLPEWPGMNFARTRPDIPVCRCGSPPTCAHTRQRAPPSPSRVRATSGASSRRCASELRRRYAVRQRPYIYDYTTCEARPATGRARRPRAGRRREVGRGVGRHVRVAGRSGCPAAATRPCSWLRRPWDRSRARLGRAARSTDGKQARRGPRTVLRPSQGTKSRILVLRCDIVRSCFLAGYPGFNAADGRHPIAHRVELARDFVVPRRCPPTRGPRRRWWAASRPRGRIWAGSKSFPADGEGQVAAGAVMGGGLGGHAWPRGE